MRANSPFILITFTYIISEGTHHVQPAKTFQMVVKSKQFTEVAAIHLEAEENLMQVYHQAMTKWGETAKHLELEDKYSQQEASEHEGESNEGGENEGGEETGLGEAKEGEGEERGGEEKGEREGEKGEGKGEEGEKEEGGDKMEVDEQESHDV